MDNKDFQRHITTFLISFNSLQKSVEKVLEAREDEDVQEILTDFIVETIAFFTVNEVYINFINDIKNKNNE